MRTRLKSYRQKGITVSVPRQFLFYVKLFFVFFYCLGAIGIILPYTNSLFTRLIPFALLLSAVALIGFHAGSTDFKTLFIFSGIYLVSFIIEVIGVNTGLIFGAYQYGDSLGIRILHTPLLIGINWLFLTYALAAVCESLKLSGIIKVLAASAGMVLYDFILEPVAVKTDMWSWSGSVIPYENYISWFIISVVFQSIIEIYGIKTRNPLANVLVICQLAFFVLLNLF